MTKKVSKTYQYCSRIRYLFMNQNIDDKSVQYITSKQKEGARLLEKDIFKVVTTNDIPSNTQIFNSYFVAKIKNFGIDKAYEKSYLFVQPYNNQEKNLVLTPLSTIQ